MSLWCQKCWMRRPICHPGDTYSPCSHNKNDELIDGEMDKK